ncbi:MAG: A/G-specific adenine glycosylase [Xanthomonadales bacterium]|nr:A/G-specific adenine glycosylase [Xanthomonadales bacterium]
MAEFSDRLLDWWDHHGRKDLPWQHPRTPYRVWVSEIMLQQTQVTTVIPYFERFMARFPDLESLAAAELDDVLSLWAGLGYYARGRNLHKAAKICVERHGGEMPDSAEALEALPGIGASTANAIISQAHDRPAVVLDGNVRRVMARHGAIEGWYGKREVAEKMWNAARDRLPQGRGADYTQAVMDLGAMLCTRSKPSCPACPVAGDCRALKTGLVAELPSARPRIRVGKKQLNLLILRDGAGAVLLERRPPAGIWGGLWSLPEHEDSSTLADRYGLAPEKLCALPPVNHRLTHLALTIHPHVAHADAVPDAIAENDDLAWFDDADLKNLGLPKPIAALLQAHTGAN